MIEKLKRKFIINSIVAILVVVGIIYVILAYSNSHNTNKALDGLTDNIAKNGGLVPEKIDSDSFSEEYKKGLRFFIVKYDGSDYVVEDFTHTTLSSETEAEKYAEKAFSRAKKRGWINDYRYKVYTEKKDGQTLKCVVLLDGSVNKQTMRMINVNIGTVIFSSGFAIAIILSILSDKLLNPIAESYNKQKQFITDVNHELKTPLTLINTNLEIIESQIGKNEWLDDIKKESARMTELVNQLVTLSRMDEAPKMQFSTFCLSDLLLEAVAEYKSLSLVKGLNFVTEIENGVNYVGDEPSITRLVGILLDNAIKYCDDFGEITVKLSFHHHPVMIFENTYKDVDKIDVSKLFDRFYRADKSRTAKGSFGIGLSLAKNITATHNGDITCYKKPDVIGFKIILKK